MGRTQGDRKDSNPATSAPNMVTSNICDFAAEP